jgi:hypothetical protein
VDGRLHPSLRFSVDARARRTYRPGEDTSRTRVYRLLGAWERGPLGPAVVVGRQFSTSLASISVFDGILGEWRGQRWAAGAFGGSQPDPIDYGFSTDIREYGAYAEWTEHPDGGVRWRLTLAGIGSYVDGEIDREYLAFQARWIGRRVVASVIQEVDFNRGWKRDVGEDAVSPTSTFATARIRLGTAWSVHGGLDTRRNVRLYRDRVTPETEFDDSYRQGYWGGVEVRPTSRTRLGASARRSTGGTAGTADAVTGRAAAVVSRLRNLDAGLRATFYRNESYDGRLVSAALSADVTSRVRTGGSFGRRTEEHRITGSSDDVDWIAIEADWTLSRAWLLLGSAEWSNGDRERTTQYHASAIYRF